MTNVQEKLLTAKREILNNDRIIESFPLSLLTGIFPGNNILFFKINNSLIGDFLDVYKIKVT